MCLRFISGLIHVCCARARLDKTLKLKPKLRNCQLDNEISLESSFNLFSRVFCAVKRQKNLQLPGLLCAHFLPAILSGRKNCPFSNLQNKAKKPGFCSFFYAPVSRWTAEELNLLEAQRDFLLVGYLNNEIQWHTLPSALIHSHRDSMRKFSHDGQRRFFVRRTAWSRRVLGPFFDLLNLRHWLHFLDPGARWIWIWIEPNSNKWKTACHHRKQRTQRQLLLLHLSLPLSQLPSRSVAKFEQLFAFESFALRAHNRKSVIFFAPNTTQVELMMISKKN